MKFETPLIISLQAIEPAPWRNGGGVTRELLVKPSTNADAAKNADAATNAATWAFRISIATVDRDGSFSAFPNIERWFAVIKGEPLKLTIDGVVHRVAKTDHPLMFKGDATIDCQLTRGATQDLNLMVRQSTPSGKHAGIMAQVTAGNAWSPRTSLSSHHGDVKAGLYSDVAGVLHWRSMDSNTLSELSVKPEELIWFDCAPRELRFEPTVSQAVPGWWMGVQ